MAGKIVQLVQGEKKALEFDDFEYWLERFSKYPIVQLIDLDAAMDRGSNRKIVETIARKLPVQVGGGIRSAQAARDMLTVGAKRVIFGSALICNGAANTEFAASLANEFALDQLMFAVDSRNGKVAVNGWRETTEASPLSTMAALEPFCGGFLYTNIETEGLMQGLPIETVRKLRAGTKRRLAVAGGISSDQDVKQLAAIGIDAVVGMAIYTGRISA
jgi:phosphoribosylformimino-5-aminoimidazole carboxamide ribotide isomerase